MNHSVVHLNTFTWTNGLMGLNIFTNAKITTEIYANMHAMPAKKYLWKSQLVQFKLHSHLNNIMCLLTMDLDSPVCEY